MRPIGSVVRLIDRMRALILGLLLATTAHANKPAIAWQWDPAPDLFPLVDLTAGTTTLSLGAGGAHPIVLKGKAWSAEVARGSDISGAAIVADDTRVFVATYNRIATGCELAAFAVDSGKRLWAVHLEGIGPISHSKYSNRVQLRLVGGHPTVFGDEAKRYIEQRDAATGALVANQILPVQRMPIPIAEPLYRELDNMLHTRDKYVVKVNDFLARHVSMTDADHAARGAAFRDAVRRLDGLPVARGAHHMHVELVETTDDFTVTATRTK